MISKIGKKVIYEESEYTILEETLDGTYIIGKNGNCETEVEEEDIMFLE